MTKIELTTIEIRELKSIYNDLYLLSEELRASHDVIDRLSAMAVTLRRILLRLDLKPIVSPVYLRDDEVLHEWPDTTRERGEAAK